MKKIICQYLLFCLILLLTCHAKAADASDHLSDLLADFHSLTANFDQVIYNAKHQPIQKSTGSMALFRPSQFRWEIKEPNPQLLIADGNYLWIYDIDLAQATHQKLDKNKLNSPASLLSGSIADLKSRFKVTQLTENPTESFRLVPKSRGDLFHWIELSFVGKKLTQMRMSDNLGSFSIFQFSDVQVNPPLSDNLFRFKAPKGVDVIEN